MANFGVITGAIFAAIVLTPTLAFGAGGSSSNTGNSQTSVKTCQFGMVFSKKLKKCVRARQKAGCPKGFVKAKWNNSCVRKRSDIIPDSDMKEQGWALAYAGKYQAAIELFKMVEASADPEKLNGLGYSHRKLGMLSKGIGYYKQALTINPDYILAREYLGEGYVAAGRFNLANLQLREIGKRCGTSCKEYVQLAKVIKTGILSDW